MRKNHNNCNVKMPEEYNKILKFNQEQKSMKIPFVIYANMKSLLEKIQTCDNDPTKSFTSKTNKHTAVCGYLLFTYCSVGNNKSKHNFNRREGSVKNFCGDLKKHATKIINFKRRKHRVVDNFFGDNQKNKSDKAVTHKIKFIHCVRFMSRLLSSLADNFTEGFEKDIRKS